MKKLSVTVLAGGVGAARLLRGLRTDLHQTAARQPCLDARRLTVVVNTADDEEFFGLHVSPDIDTILYTLGGLAAPAQGWGIRDDTFTCLQQLSRFYPETWFQLGDRDLATHIFRTDALRRGETLSEVCAVLAKRLGVPYRILPMTNDKVRTFVHLRGEAPLPFQSYLVRRRGLGRVDKIEVRGASRATPSPGVREAILGASCVILPPSNPFVSIGPILALPGVRQALRTTQAPVVAVTPIVAGNPIKGPLHHMLRGLGHEVSVVGVAKLYRGLADIFVLDQRDAGLVPKIQALGMQTLVTDTLMTTLGKSRRLAGEVLGAAVAWTKRAA